MIKYYFNNDYSTEIFLTNETDIKIIQAKNPTTQQPFSSKDEAIAWAKDLVVNGYNEELVDGNVTESTTETSQTN